MLKVSFNDTALIWLDKSRSWHHLGFTALRKLLIIASVYVCVCVCGSAFYVLFVCDSAFYIVHLCFLFGVF